MGIGENPQSNWSVGHWSPRARLYGAALIFSLTYLLIGRLSSDDFQWVQVYLPLSASSVLLLGASAVEAYFLMHRMRRHHAELLERQAHEREQAQQLAQQRQSSLNEISRALLDKLDLEHVSADVLEKIARLFDADVAGIWAVESAPPRAFVLKGVYGLAAAAAKQLATITRTTPCFNALTSTGQPIALDLAAISAPEFASFCQAEQLDTGTLTPVLCHDKVAGVVGVFYRSEAGLNATATAELQAVANIVAGAIQAEDLYRDLVQVQKVESLGSLASGIAHDFNNVLAAVLASASYVRQQTDPGHATHRYLEAIETSAQRGAALTKQLLSFVRRERPRVTVLNVNQCVEQTLTILERSFDKIVVLQRHLARDLRPVEMDPSQLEQVILNIAVNARDAMPDGGTFTIATHNVRLNQLDPQRPPVSLPDGDYVCLTFRDTGSGMDAATIARIFEPFYTTKAQGRGTGLGLSVVRSIVRSFAGEIRASSVLGRGALFEVYLPVTTKPMPAPPPPPPAKARGGRECILLAEDEDIIREMAQLELEARGYRVVAAVDGQAALERYQQEWPTVDLAVVDMVMPRLSGPELFSRMKEINPGVRVIVSSGYSHDLEGQRMLERGCLGFLQKPYNAEALAHSIRAVLDSGL
jgi:signal transduction histidine kinase/CheY-like chemotaxis protein